MTALALNNNRSSNHPKEVSKRERQYNGQNKKDKRSFNELQNIAQNIKHWQIKQH